MATVKVGESIDSGSIIWRYMSLDKFIHLLESKSLYFSSLSSFRDTDPFEGYYPKVMIEALSKVYRSSFEKINSTLKHLNKLENCLNPDGVSTLEEANKLRASLPDILHHAHKSLVSNITVNCWHQNDLESEAMWRLYSEAKKGIAIKTTVGSAIKAFEMTGQQIPLAVGKVKYLDFFDKSLKPNDCLVDGSISPLVKRYSYSHENEIRFYTIPSRVEGEVTEFKSKEANVEGDLD